MATVSALDEELNRLQVAQQAVVKQFERQLRDHESIETAIQAIMRIDADARKGLEAMADSMDQMLNLLEPFRTLPQFFRRRAEFPQFFARFRSTSLCLASGLRVM